MLSDPKSFIILIAADGNGSVLNNPDIQDREYDNETDRWNDWSNVPLNTLSLGSANETNTNESGTLKSWALIVSAKEALGVDKPYIQFRLRAKSTQGVGEWEYTEILRRSDFQTIWNNPDGSKIDINIPKFAESSPIQHINHSIRSWWTVA